jgi:deoxyhypusine synthase
MDRNPAATRATGVEPTPVKNMPAKNSDLSDKVEPIVVQHGRSITDLLSRMGKTGFQGRKLFEVKEIFKAMINDPDTTILFGYSGSLSVAGQSDIINWLIENKFIDILISTGANISEDLVNSIGHSYYRGDISHNDGELFKLGINRYHDIYGRESDYLHMTELISDFILTLDEAYNYSSREFLYLFGVWLQAQNINSIVSKAAKHKIPIYCPAIVDSPYGDAALIAKSRDFSLKIDSVKDYIEFMGLAEHVSDTGVVYLGGGVPKDFIQLFAVTGDFLYPDRRVPNREKIQTRNGVNETYYPHKYAIQITTDSPQWGGLSGCTFEEAVSWGKEKPNGKFAQCYCDATIALPIIMHAIAEDAPPPRNGNRFDFLFTEPLCHWGL